MADTGGKKTKKKKGVKISLNDFLTKESGSSTTSQVYTPRKVDWAEETEDLAGEDAGWSDDYYRPKPNYVDRSKLPTAPKASLSAAVDHDRLPKGPPYTAFIGNLPYDVEQEDIYDFFKGKKVKDVRIPRENDTGRIKGFGYVEFEDLDSMISALALNEENMKNRKIRVDVADSAGQGEKDGYNKDRSTNQDPDDWRARKEPSFPPPHENDRYSDRGGFDRGYNRGGYDRDGRGGYDRDGGGYGRDGGGYDRDSRGGYGRDDRGYGRDGGGYGRDGGGYGRDGGGYDRDSRGGYGRDGGGYDRYRRGGYGRDGGGYDRDSRGGYGRDSQGGYDRGDDSSDWRRGGGSGQGWSQGDRDRDGDRRGYGGRSDGYGRRGDGYDRHGDDYDRKDSPEPAERPKLQLKPRSVPLDKQEASSVPKPSIFGNAKPVDTATKEQEIEKRLERERQREEELKRQEREEKESERSIIRSNRRISDSEKTPRVRSDSGGSGTARHRERKDSSGPRDRKDRERKTSNSESGGVRERSNSSTYSDPNSESGSLHSPRTFSEAPSENPWGKRTTTAPEKEVKEEVIKNGIRNDEVHSSRSEEHSGTDNSWGPRRGGGTPARGRGRGRGRGGGGEHDRGHQRSEEKKREKPEKSPKGYQEPKQPVFSHQSKFSLLADDDDGFDETEDLEEVQS